MNPYQQPPDNSKKFMQTGVGILALVLTICLGAPAVVCLMSAFVSAFQAAGSVR